MSFKEVLIILIPIVAVITLAMLIILLILYLNKKRYQLARNSTDFLGVDRQKQLDAIMNRVHVIAESNQKYRNVMLQLDDLHSQFSLENDASKELVTKINDLAKKKRLINREFKKVYNELLKQKTILEELEKKFHAASNQVMQQDNLIRNEFTFYQSCLRRTTNLYKEKRILLDNIATQIDDLNEKIKLIEKEFEDVIISADSQKANILLRRYIVNVVKLTKVINEGPAIGMHIKTQILELVDRINKLYAQKKDGLEMPLDHINFSQSLKLISKKFQSAKASYEELDMDRAKELIVEILKALKTLENRINLEIKSGNVFFQDHEEALEVAKRALSDWNSISNQLKEISGSGKEISPEIFDQYNVVKESTKSLESLANDFKAIVKNRTMAFSAKAQRMKMMIVETQNVVKQLNAFVELLWNLNLTESLTKNKFKRSEAAMNELVANVKMENIKLSSKEKIDFDKLIDEKTAIANILAGPSRKGVAEVVDKFSEKVVNLYSIINGNAQIAMHIKNMLRELAPQRSMDAQLNANLSLAEKDFMEGKYDAALNLIIDTISERGKK